MPLEGHAGNRIACRKPSQVNIRGREARQPSTWVRVRAPCASPRRWPAPGCARGARPSAGSNRAASSVNGELLKSPARDVAPADRILVDGNPLPAPEPPRLWRYHKPKGRVTTHSDPQGRPTVFEALPEEMPRVISIGRLDFNTEGLLLLTNDGALARHLELPATGWLRRYRVRAHGAVTQEALDKLKEGIEIAGVRYGPIEASLDKVQGANVWLSIGLREGKNREVRKILDTLNLTVNRLIRTSFGPFQLLDMLPGVVEPVQRRVLVDQLSAGIARELGLMDPEREGGEGRAPKARTEHRPGMSRLRVLHPCSPRAFARREGRASARGAKGHGPNRDRRR